MSNPFDTNDICARHVQGYHPSNSRSFDNGIDYWWSKPEYSEKTTDLL